MKITYKCECDIPDYSLQYLINGNVDGISDEDKKIIDDWLKTFNDHNFVINIDSDETFFTHYPEFGLPCNCYNCTLTFVER